MADVTLNGTEYQGVEEVKLPLSDGSGYATFSIGGGSGVGIENIEQTVKSEADDGNNVLKITLTNGDSTTFTVQNGSKGSKGEPGENGSDANVTTENIKSALGYTPADEKVVSQLSEDIADLTKTVEPEEDDIPKVFISGEIPTTKDDVLAEMEYNSKTEQFHAFLKIKCQGTSSMAYAKKNFTVKLYSDEARETKLKKEFRDWGKQSKYCLKANFIDHSHARNIINANLWDEVVSSRSDYNSLPDELRNSPRNGAVDGFPIKVYTNGTYQGIYTWNIPKDAWMVGMDEDNPNHALLCGETNTDGVYAENACNFRALWSGVDKEDWEIEVGTNSDALKTSLNNMISCVKDTDDETFKATIGNYLDVQSAIDYYLHQYVICGMDGLAKNMLLATYDGVKWFCSAYDMDSTWGNHFTGQIFLPANYACPEDYQEQFSLLWERIEANFYSELEQRYVELRKTVYSLPNIVTKFERFMDNIGSDLYAEDGEIYPAIPMLNGNNIKQIRNFVRDRLVYVDTEIVKTATNVLRGITFERGSIDASGAELSSDYDVRSSFVDISSLQDGSVYHYVIDGSSMGAKAVFYTEDGSYAQTYDPVPTLNAQYGYGEAFVIPQGYSIYSPVKQVRLVINVVGGHTKLYFGIYKLVDDVPVLVDQTYIYNPVG